VISSDVRHAIGRAVAAAGLEPAEPGLRPTGTPGQYASSVAFAFGEHPERVAARIAALLTNTGLAHTGHIMHAEVTGPGFITITVPPEALADLPERIAAAGPGCAVSDALRGLTVPAPPPGDPLAAPSWEEATAALAAQLTARLAAAAGATVTLSVDTERTGLASSGDQSAVGGGDTVRSAAKGSGPIATGRRRETGVAAAVAFAGCDAVRFSLARAVPGRPVRIDPQVIARHVLDNPAYAVRYAHARAASGMRWAASGGNGRERGGPGGTAGGDDQGGWQAGMGGGSLPWGEAGAPEAGRPPSVQLAETAVLLDALSWLPERVATAARRGRPDEFARYLEELASATIVALISPSDPGSARAPGTDRLSLARAARTGLAAGLGLLGVSAPDRV
jgi:arginyl-tRNA synthetase